MNCNKQLESLLAVPHVGLYTADTVRYSSFGGQVPVVDVNVIRVITCYFGINPGSASGMREIYEAAKSILPGSCTREFNYTMLDFGALVCKVRRPLCDQCPICSH